MDSTKLYVLTSLSIDGEGNVTSRNVGVTFNVFNAEEHKTKGIENDFETFEVSADWQADAAQADLIVAMRCFREIVREIQEEALR